MAYLTISELKSSNVLDEIKDCDDLKLQFLLDYCSGLIDAYVENDFYAYPNQSKIVSGEGEKILPLPKRIYNIIQVKDILSNIQYANVIIKEDNESLYCRDDVFDDDVSNIEVIGDWGWKEVPSDVKLCLIRLCNTHFDNVNDEDTFKKWSSPFKSEKIGNYQYQLKDLTNMITGEEIKTTGDPYVDKILDKYKASEYYIEVI